MWQTEQALSPEPPRIPAGDQRSRGFAVVGAEPTRPGNSPEDVAGAGWSALRAVHIGAAPRHSSKGSRHHPAQSAQRGRGSYLRSHRSIAGTNFDSWARVPSPPLWRSAESVLQKCGRPPPQAEQATPTPGPQAEKRACSPAAGAAEERSGRGPGNGWAERGTGLSPSGRLRCISQPHSPPVTVLSWREVSRWTRLASRAVWVTTARETASQRCDTPIVGLSQRSGPLGSSDDGQQRRLIGSNDQERLALPRDPPERHPLTTGRSEFEAVDQGDRPVRRGRAEPPGRSGGPGRAPSASHDSRPPPGPSASVDG
jgi:hypothetical protein